MAVEVCEGVDEVALIVKEVVVVEGCEIGDWMAQI